MHEPAGAIEVGSPFYVERQGDEQLGRQLGSPAGTTTTIQAPRQTGKSSLLFRGVARSRARGCTVAFLDLQAVPDRDLQSLDAFLWYLANTLVAELGADSAEMERIWQTSQGTPDKTSRFLEKCVLSKKDRRIVLAMDEADRLLRTGFHRDVFGLLRSWHNRRRSIPSEAATSPTFW